MDRNNIEKKVVFDPPGEPGEGNDWVLVLDNAAKGYPPPGKFKFVVPASAGSVR